MKTTAVRKKIEAIRAEYPAVVAQIEAIRKKIEAMRAEYPAVVAQTEAIRKKVGAMTAQIPSLREKMIKGCMRTQKTVISGKPR